MDATSLDGRTVILLKYTDKSKACRCMLSSVPGLASTSSGTPSVGRGISADAPPVVGRANQLCRPSPQVHSLTGSTLLCNNR
ncbi:hypothetical protein BC826DRAFT_1023111 [Russula brevipes]|nr:hypothetical protein BC826DRAFT_1023111 [Russula brevipes]